MSKPRIIKKEKMVTLLIHINFEFKIENGIEEEKIVNIRKV